MLIYNNNIKRFMGIMSICFLLGFVNINASWWNSFFRDIPAIQYPDIKQDNDYVIVTMAVPGDVDPNNIAVDITDKTLHVYGKSEIKNEVKEADFYKKEMSSSSFNRSVSLPCRVDELGTKAELINGVLIISMPKVKEEDKAAKKIKVVHG